MRHRPEPDYDAARAASYWSGPRHEGGDELASVLSLGERHAVNEAYDAWEVGLLLESIEGRPFRLGLDLGTGVGRVATRLAARLPRLVCADLATGMLERARQNARRAGVRNLDPVRLRSDPLPFRDGAVDLVVCLGLMEHLPPASRRATLQECARVLAPGGFLVVALNNSRSRFLRDPSDNPLRDGTQQKSGYFCAVVEDAAFVLEAAQHFEDRVQGSNLFYSLHRHAARRLTSSERRSPELRPFFLHAAAWDRAVRPVGPLAEAAADHHLHLLVRR